MSSERKIIYYDGTCPMCSVVAEKIASSSEKEQFELKDIHQEELLPYSKEEHMKEIFVIAPDGAKRGAEAFLSILATYPRWRLFARVGNLPFIKPFLRLGYRFVASNRYFLSRCAARKRKVY